MKEAIELLCEKLGMVIDWGAENVWPQVMEVLGRYRIYEIIENAFAAVMFMTIIVAYIVFVKKVITERQLIIQKFNEYARLPHYSEERANFKLHPNKYFDDNMTMYPDTTGTTFGILFGGGIATILSLAFLIFGVIPDLFKWIVVPELQWIDVIQSLVK